MNYSRLFCVLTIFLALWNQSEGNDEVIRKDKFVHDMTSNISSCLLKCKDNHMKEMDNEWSAKFVFPLLSLLHNNQTLEAAYDRAYNTCHSIYEYGQCLNSCPESIERKIMKRGNEPWEDMCKNLKSLKNHFKCWKDNIEALANSCRLEGDIVRERMKSFALNFSIEVVENVCKAVNLMNECAIKEYGSLCGEVTSTLLKRFHLNDQLAFRDILKMRWDKIPKECESTSLHNQTLLLKNHSTKPTFVFKLFVFSILSKIMFQQ
uniref:CPG4 domain-containing protein n=1 Tax=Rhabditophanes sp. KR3021 TaxID=114890 RepID=A0AC35U7P4_9BILA